MQKCFIDMEKRFSKATLILLFLSILTLAVIITPMAKAQTQSQSITLSPSTGPAGTTVMASINGFLTSSSVSITFDTTNVGTANVISPPGGAIGIAYEEFTVPSVSPGTYTITATGSTGVATATFTVTQGTAPTPTATPTATPTGSTGSTGSTGFSTPYVPVTVSSSGFWSPLAIAITAVVIAFAVFMTAVYVMRGRQKPLPYEEASRYEPRPSTPSMTSNAPSNINRPYQPYQPSNINRPYQPYKPYQPSNINRPYQSYQPSKINQPYQPYQPSNINRPATNIQQPHFTRVCQHCKRTVRDDVNICPYCSKRIK